MHKSYPQTSNRKIPSFIQTHKNTQDYLTDFGFFAAANVEHCQAESLSLPTWLQLAMRERSSRCLPSCKLEERLGGRGNPEGFLFKTIVLPCKT